MGPIPCKPHLWSASIHPFAMEMEAAILCTVSNVHQNATMGVAKLLLRYDII